LCLTLGERTMPVMAKKKSKRNPPNYQHPRVVFHCPEALLSVIDQRAEENGRTRTSELVMVLREAYREMGLYPPISGDDEAEEPDE
jgi:hypothetical protein